MQVQNSILAMVNTSRHLSLTKHRILSLSILTLNLQNLYQKVEDECLSNPALIFLNHKFLRKNFQFEDTLAGTPDNLEDNFLCEVSKQIENLNCTLEIKTFLQKIFHNFLDEKFFLKKRDFIEKYRSVKYQNWLNYFKRLNPPGIGASHLQERFKYQLEFYGLKKTLSYQIVDECWKFFLLQNFKKIQILLKKNEFEVQSAILKIKKYCKTNIIEFENESEVLIQNYPDVILKENNVELNEQYLPKIQICEKFIQLSKLDTDFSTSQYIKNKINSAKNLLTAINKRNKTLLEISSTIADLQKEYIKNPKAPFKRITLKELSLKTNYSQSTISRALKNKGILTPSGIKMIEKFIRH